MKKRCLYAVITVIIMSCIFIVEANAEDLFRYEFETKGNTFSYINTDYFNQNKTASFNATVDNFTILDSLELSLLTTASSLISYRDGYIGIDIINEETKQGTSLTYYDSKGNIAKQNFIKDYYIITGSIIRYLIDLTVEYSDKLYCIAISSHDQNQSVFENMFYTLVINEDLKVEKNLANKVLLNKVDDKFYLVDLQAKEIYDILCTSDIELNKFETVPALKNIVENISPAGINKIIKELKTLIPILPKYQWIASSVVDDLIISFSKINFETTTNDEINNALESLRTKNPIISLIGDVELIDVSDKYILVRDKKSSNYKIMNTKGEIILDKKLDTQANTLQIIHDYIFAITRNLENPSITSKIDVFDISGNRLQTITSDKDNQILYVKEIKSGFTAINVNTKQSLKQGGISNNKLLNNTGVEYTNKVYSMPQSIKINVIGNGSIKVNSEARFGDTVAFSLEKMDGHILKLVQVYDELGNVLEVTDGTFIMPNGEVTIHAEFVEELKENPKTGLRSLITFIMIALLLGIYYKINKKSLTIFKKI